CATHSPKFNVIPIREISLKLPIEVTKRTVNVQKRKELLEKTLKWKRDKERIHYWTNMAFKELEAQGSLDFTPFFFKIIEEDQLTIAVKTAHNIIRRNTTYKNKFNVDIKKEPVRDITKKGISLWQMTIQKK